MRQSSFSQFINLSYQRSRCQRRQSICWSLLRNLSWLRSWSKLSSSQLARLKFYSYCYCRNILYALDFQIIYLYTSFFDFSLLLSSPFSPSPSSSRFPLASNPAKCIFSWNSSNSSSFSKSLQPKFTSSKRFMSFMLTPLWVRLIVFRSYQSGWPAYQSRRANFLAFLEIFIILLFLRDYRTRFWVSVSFYIFLLRASARRLACLPNAEPGFYCTAADGLISFVDLYFLAMLKTSQQQLYYIYTLIICFIKVNQCLPLYYFIGFLHKSLDFCIRSKKQIA